MDVGETNWLGLFLDQPFREARLQRRSLTVAVEVLGDGVWLGWEGSCGWGIRIWLFVDLEGGGLHFEGWENALCLLIGLGFGIWVDVGFPYGWGVVTEDVLLS